MFQRDILKDLKQYIFSDEFLLLYGPRQVGKTTLLSMLQEYCNEKEYENIFLSLENNNILQDINTDPKNLFSHIPQTKKRIIVFIDEIQYLDKPSNFLKYIYDLHKTEIKIVATGSASLEIKSKTQDSLAGRHYSFRIMPLNFFEFLLFKKRNDILQQWNFKQLSPSQKIELKQLLDEFLLYGGMPAVVQKQSFKEKKQLLYSYTESYIKKDIRSLAVISNITQYNFLMKMLSSQIGNLLNINHLAENLSISVNTVARYIDILKHSHIIQTTPPYIQSVHKQIRKMNKIYFYDTGIRNTILNNFEDIPLRNDSGQLFENMMANELQSISHNIYFYRTKNDAEIDFILDEEKVSLIEIKYKNLKTAIIPKIFYSFGATQKKQEKQVINLSLNTKKEDVTFIEWYNFLQKRYQKETLI